MTTTASGAQARAARSTIERLYELEQRKELDAWLDLWADDLTIVFPHAVDPESRAVRGKGELREITAAKFRDRETIRVEVTTASFEDPSQVLASLEVDITFAADGKRLRLPILCRFTLGADGRIVLLEEFVNEAVL